MKNKSKSIDAQLEMLKQLGDLNGISPLVLAAPATAADIKSHRTYEVLPPNTIRYLSRYVVGKPWLNHLTLALLILTARGYDRSGVYTFATLIHKRMCGFATARSTRFTSMEDFNENINECLRLYLSKVIVCQDSDSSRNNFYQRYQSIAACSHEWLMSIPVALRDNYRTLLFRGIKESEVRHLLKYSELQQIQQQTRKAEVDAVMPNYVAIRQQAHFRFNFLARLADAYRKVLSNIGVPNDDGFVEFQYVDSGYCYLFRVWRSQDYQKGELWSSSRKNIVNVPDYIPELICVKAEVGGEEISIDERLWFIDILRYGMNLTHLSQDEVNWYKSQEYPKSAFVVQPGLIAWRSIWFMKEVNKRSSGIFLPIFELYHAAAFGLLAIDLFTTTGVRMNEAMQISLDPKCFVRLEIAAHPGSDRIDNRIRYSLRLVPKGERTNERSDNFIGIETKRILVRVAKMLEEHYELGSNASLPIVPFDPNHRRAHRFEPSRYLFQLHRKHLSQATISGCIRFLIHGMDFRTIDGKCVSIRAHLLRHAFATHAVQVEKIPVDIVGKWLHQKSVAVTEYYSAPTATMVADAADSYLAKIASHINVEQEVFRSPEQIRKLYEDSISRTGTLAQVVGGSCGSHGLCQSQLACIGCAAKIPEPEKRDQVIHQREWATKELIFYKNEGLMPAARKVEQFIRYADDELREMDSIEAYRADEAKIAIVKRGT